MKKNQIDILVIPSGMQRVIIPIFLLISSFSSLAQEPDSAIVNTYLRKEMRLLNMDSTLPDDFFDDGTLKNSLFLFGENHGSEKPQMADILLFKHFHKHAGVRHYLAEVDVIKAWMINNYLKDGKEAWLTKIFKSWIEDTAQWANKSNYRKFQQLREFYQSQPSNKKFTVIGIDAIQDYSLMKEYNHFLLQEKSFPSSIRRYLDSLNQLTDTINYGNRKVLGALAQRMLAEIKSSQLQTKSIPDEKEATLQHYIQSLSFLRAGMYRDSIMFRNFESMITLFNLRKSKFYGFLGFFHCLQSGYEKTMPFAALVKLHSANISNKIISIQMFAIQSKTLLPYSGQIKQMMPQNYADKLRRENTDFSNSQKYIPYDLSNDAQMMLVKGIDYLKSLTSQNSTTLFRLNGPGSPFATSKLLAEVTGFQTVRTTAVHTKTTEAFQYAILFRNSKAGVPLE